MSHKYGIEYKRKGIKIMARKIKCRWLKTFRLSWKCRKCKYRRRCEKVVKRRKFGMAMMVLIVIVLMVCGVWKAVTKGNNVIQDEKVEFVKAEYFTKSKCQNIVPTKTKTPEKKTITPVEPTFTEVEIEALGKVIFKEAAGEPYIGKVAVGAVVMNRLKTGSREFYAHNGNLMDVILYDGAFASIEDFSDEEFEAAIEHDDCIDRKSVV